MKREGIFALFFIVLAILPLASSSVIINEVMPHSNNSYGGEWAELYNNGASNLNLTGWIISDGSGNDTFTLNIPAGGFALIVDNSENNCSFFSISNESCFEVSTIGSSGLRDDGESVILYDNNSILTSNFSWDVNIKSSGKSWGYNGTAWLNCTPTPGSINNCPGPNQPPAANFTYSPLNLTANQTASFDASSSSDSDGSITLYSWDFGDSATAAGITAQHAFTIAGNFTVNLTVTDSNNSQASITKTISVVQNQTQQNQTSQAYTNAMLEITYAPSEAYFDSEIQINASVYRNDTAKYAIDLWIEDNEKEKFSDITTFHARNSTSSKLANYTFNVSLQIDNECNAANRTFIIVLEGLDEKINKSIILKENSTLCKPDFEYIITQPTAARINETFSTKIRITNNRNKDTEFDVWSYVYRGSKCYSCTTIYEDREENMQHISVDANTPSEILLDNIIENAEPGDYSLKVKILREGTSTPKEYTYSILLEAMPPAELLSEKSSLENNLNAQTNNNTNNTLATGNAVYESKTELNKKYAQIILASTLILAMLYFLFRQKIIEMREHGV